jgi:hypothetical protein
MMDGPSPKAVHVTTIRPVSSGYGYDFATMLQLGHRHGHVRFGGGTAVRLYVTWAGVMKEARISAEEVAHDITEDLRADLTSADDAADNRAVGDERRATGRAGAAEAALCEREHELWLPNTRTSAPATTAIRRSRTN